MQAPIAVTDADLSQLSHPESQGRFPVLPRPVAMNAAMLANHSPCPPPTRRVLVYHVVHCLTLHRGPGHFELMFYRIALSRLSSATNIFSRRSLPAAASTRGPDPTADRHRLSSSGLSPARRTPNCRVASATLMPSSICFNVTTICSTEDRFFFTAISLPIDGPVCRKTNLQSGPILSWGLTLSGAAEATPSADTKQADRHRSPRARAAGHPDGAQVVAVRLDRTRRPAHRHRAEPARYLPPARRRSLNIPRRRPEASLPSTRHSRRRTHPLWKKQFADRPPRYNPANRSAMNANSRFTGLSPRGMPTVRN